jgi:hypothetical protein
MQFSASATKGWSRWQPYAATAAWSLARGDGQQSVFARFQDGDGNVSPVAAAQILLDTVAPAGALAIDAGAAYTTASAVTLTATCADAPSGCVLMQFSNDGVAWTALEPVRATRSWTLALGSGTRTVHVRYQDGAGNLSAAKSDQIVVDAVAPAGTVAINSGDAGTRTRSVTLTFTCADTGGSGCATVQLSNDGTTWGVPQPYASSAAWDLSAADGTKTVSARFVDGAGNVSPLATAEIALDTSAPAGTVAINGGEAATSARAVTLTLACTDTGSGCAQMQFSATDARGWSKPQPFSTSAPFTLSSGTGTMSVYVRFIDAVGNAVIVSDTIVKQ